MHKRSREDSICSSSTSVQSNVSPIATSNQPVKYLRVTPEAAPVKVMQCSLPPHDPISFSTYEEYDVHYAQVHTNRCSECRANFPTEHFLDLHISENHDPIRAALQAKGEKTYRCFIPDCEKVCSVPQKRRMHLIDKHLYPKNYDFHMVNTGLDKRRSMLRSKPTHYRNRSSTSHPKDQAKPSMPPSNKATTSASLPSPSHPNRNDRPTATEEGMEDDGDKASGSHTEPTSPSSSRKSSQDPQADMDALAESMASLKFVPRSIRFGRGGGKAGLARS